MILQALTHYYEDLLALGQMTPARLGHRQGVPMGWFWMGKGS